MDHNTNFLRRTDSSKVSLLCNKVNRSWIPLCATLLERLENQTRFINKLCLNVLNPAAGVSKHSTAVAAQCK